MAERTLYLLRARILRRLRFSRRIRFFLHLARILATCERARAREKQQQKAPAENTALQTKFSQAFMPGKGEDGKGPGVKKRER
jgi:hypothetical protein